MGTTTTPLGFRIPDGNELPALDILLGHLAHDVDAYLSAAWQAYTPTLGGVNLGNGSIVGRCKRIGSVMHFRAAFQWGSTTTATTPAASLAIGLPAPGSLAINVPWGSSQFIDASASNTRSFGVLVYSGVSSVLGLLHIGAVVSAVTPVAMAVGDQLTVTGTYEVAV